MEEIVLKAQKAALLDVEIYVLKELTLINKQLKMIEETK